MGPFKISIATFHSASYSFSEKSKAFLTKVKNTENQKENNRY